MESMREVLRRSLGRSLGALPELDRLRAAWPVACGPALACRGEIVAYEAATVRVRVADPAWLDQLRSLQAVLAHELAKIAAVPVDAIHFEGMQQKETRR